MKLAIVFLFSLMSLFVFAQEQKEGKQQVIEPTTSVELTAKIAISEEMALVLYPADLQKFVLVYETKSIKRRIFADAMRSSVVFSETKTTRKTLKETVLTAQTPEAAVVKFSEQPIRPERQECLPMEPIVVTQSVKLKRIYGQLLFSVLGRIAEAIREQYTQNPEKKTLVFGDLKLDQILKNDIEFLLTRSLKSFYSKTAEKTSKKEPKIGEQEKIAKAEAKRLKTEQKAKIRAEKRAKTLASLVAQIEILKARTQERCKTNTELNAFQQEAFVQLEQGSWEAFKAANKEKLAAVFNKTALKTLDRYAKALEKRKEEAAANQTK